MSHSAKSSNTHKSNMSEFDSNLPNIRQIQNFIKDKQEVELKLLTSESLTGMVQWQDIDCLCLIDRNEQRTIVWRQAIAYVKPKA